MTLDEAIKRYIDNAEYERIHGSLQGCLEFKQLAEWLKELKQLREQIRWIPVSERLPKKGTRVLTCSNDGYIEIQSIESTYGYWENEEGDWSDIDEITAWMPLPRPYKEESEVSE